VVEDVGEEVAVLLLEEAASGGRPVRPVDGEVVEDGECLAALWPKAMNTMVQQNQSAVAALHKRCGAGSQVDTSLMLFRRGGLPIGSRGG